MASKLNVWTLGKTLKYKLIDFMGNFSHKVEFLILLIYLKSNQNLESSTTIPYFKCNLLLNILIY